MSVFCANEMVFLTTGTELVLVCNISMRNSITYPPWWGPPDFTKYNTISGQFNPNLGEKLNRMKWANNNIDLKLDSVTINDAGLYTCNVLFQQRVYSYDIEVNVRGTFKYVSKLYSTSDLF